MSFWNSKSAKAEKRNTIKIKLRSEYKAEEITKATYKSPEILRIIKSFIDSLLSFVLQICALAGA